MQGSGQFPIYSGSRYQVGGGLLAPLARFAIPLLKSAAHTAVKTAALETSKHLPSAISALMSNSVSGRGVAKNAIKQIAKSTALAAVKDASAGVSRKRKQKAKPELASVPKKAKRGKRSQARKNQRDIFS